VVAVTVWKAGLAYVRCHDHPRAAEIDGVMRGVLAAMGVFVGDSDWNKRNPVCLASQANIAERAGYRVTAVAKAQKRLEELGLIVRDGHGARQSANRRPTVRWRLVVLAEPATPTGSLTDPTDSPSSVPRTEEGTSVPRTEEVSVPRTEEVSVPRTDNPSESSGGPPEEDGGRSTSADAPASAGAPADAAPVSKDGGAQDGTIVGEVMAARGCSQAEAERWISRKIDGASGPVRNEPAFLRTCLAKELEAKEQPTKGRRSDQDSSANNNNRHPAAPRGRKPVKGAAKTSPKRGRRSGRALTSVPVSVQQQAADEYLRLLRNETKKGRALAEVAERFDMTTSGVETAYDRVRDYGSVVKWQDRWITSAATGSRQAPSPPSPSPPSPSPPSPPPEPVSPEPVSERQRIVALVNRDVAQGTSVTVALNGVSAFHGVPYPQVRDWYLAARRAAS
jgi:hypothetical protein